MKNSKNSILNGFKGNGKKNIPFQEILKGVYDASKINKEDYDIFSKKQIKCYINGIIKENTGVSKEIQKSVLNETYGELNKLIPITLKKGDKQEQFFISKKGECKEILKAFEPVNDDEDYFDDEESFDEEEVLEFIRDGEVDDDDLIDEFGDGIIDFVNKLHEDGKIDVDEENGVYKVSEDSDEKDKKEEEDKESDLDDKEEKDKKEEEEKVADEDTKEEDDKKEEEKAKDDEDANKDEELSSDGMGLKGEEIDDRFEDRKDKEDKKEKDAEEEADQAKEDLNKEEKDLEEEKDKNKEDLDKSEEDLDDKKENPFDNKEKDLLKDDNNLDDKEDDNVEDDNKEEDLNDKEEVEDEYSPEELERMAKKTATSTLIKFYKNSNDENKKDIAKLELKIRGIDVDSFDEEKHNDKDELPETREELKKLENWMQSMFNDYDSEDLREYVSGLILQSPAKTKELKNHYRDYYKMNNAGNTLAKVDNAEFKTWLIDTYLKNFSDGDLQQYSLNLVSKNPIEYNKLKKTYKTYEENGML